MKRFIQFFVMTLAVLAMAQTAGAVGTFSVIGNYDSSTNKTTFRITRTAGTSVTETVYYRTVSLGAIDGQHFTAMSGSLTFDAEHNTLSIVVEEKTPSTNAYKYQTTGRSYRFEVLDVNGFELAGATRNLSTSGTQISSTNAFAVKDVTVNSGTITVKDENYAQAYHAVPVATYFNNAAPQNYFVTAGAELRMTLTFSAAEKDDGYQHLQILVNHPVQEGVTNWDEGAGDNQPGTMNYSSYLATFCHKGGSTYTTYADYSFPVTSLSDWTYNSNNKQYAWTSLGNTVGDLRNQQFNTNCRASDDGRLVISTKAKLSSFSTVGIRFDASGDNDDTWYAQNTVAHIQAVDGTNPTLFNGTSGIIVSAGPYVKGSTFYVSVPFSEIVKVTGTPTLTNNWGTLSYTSGSGSNVLTFKGTITNNLGTALKVSGLSGTVTDLAGNSFTWTSSTKTFSAAVSSGTYTLATANTEFTGLDDEYVLSDNSPIEPHPTIYFYKGKMTEANRVTLAETTDYTLAWADNTLAGTGIISASGTGSYTGDISTTFPIRWATYTLRLHHNDGTDDYTDMAMTYNTAANIQTITRTGYTFDRWTTGADGSGTPYTEGQEVLNLTNTDGEVIDLYAQWTAHTYTVRFNRNEGTGAMIGMTFTYGVAQHLTANAFTRTGCIFDGWNTAADGSGDSYTDGQEVINLTPENRATVTLYAQWNDLWDVKNGADGSEAHPYLITTTAGLDLLASDVNSGTDYSGTYFKLDADIAYDPNALDANGENYTTIGGPDGSIIRKFNGTFDGDGHTVSGIRINKTGTDTADRCQGLFGYLGNTGTVQNVILNDARITGYDFVGGIAGLIYSSSSIKNCCVLNTAIIITNEGTDNVGVISGHYLSGTQANNYHHNYYHNCSITQGGTTSTTNIGARSSDRYGARSVHSLTLPTNVTATGESVTISGTTYYVSAYQVTLNYSVPEGVRFNGFLVNGEPIADNWFTMPAADVVITLDILARYTFDSTTGVLSLNWGEFNKDNKWGSDVTASAVTSVTATDQVSFTGDCTELFRSFSHCTSMDLNNVNTSGMTVANSMIRLCSNLTTLDLSNWDMSNVTDLRFMFEASSALTTLNLSGWSFGNNANLREMFYNCTSLTTLDLSGWNTSNVTDMYNMFKSCTNLTSLDLSGWNTANVTDMSGMFNGCEGLTSLMGISAWNTANVTSMNGMFNGCDGLTTLDLSAWNTANVTDMSYMFNLCSSLSTLDLTNWNTSKVAYMKDMFNGCTGLTTLDLSAWNTAKVTRMDNMFYGCEGLTTIYAGSGWSTKSVNNSSKMFYGCTSLVGGCGTTYQSRYVSSTYACYDRGDDGQGYLTGVFTVTLPEDVTANFSTDPILSHGDTDYYTAGTTVTLTYNGTLPMGYVVSYSYNDGSNHAITDNTFTLPTSDVTITAKLIFHWIGSGTVDDPYQIWNYEGLKEFARIVNGTGGQNAKPDACAILMDDIQCKNSPDDMEYATDWEPIGNNSQKYTGTFDGQGYTITGLSTPTDNSSNYVGLFGYINGGSVSNLILDNATITGYNYVGGIAGVIDNATLTHCFVVNSSITTTYTMGNRRGVIAGDFQGASNCSNNYYHNCTVNGKNTYIGAYNSDQKWACRVMDITLPDHVTATGESITYNGTTYYSTYNSPTITLHYEGTVPDGMVPMFTVTSSDGSNDNIIYTLDTFQMKAFTQVLTVSVALCEVYSLTLLDGISATGLMTMIGATTYAVCGTPVTLSNPDLAPGYAVVYSVNDTPIEGNTFEMPAQDVTVSASIIDVWGIADDADGTSEHPYVITTPEGLQLLSTYTDNNNTYGMYFQLGADIDMSSITDFTPIGNGYSFSGTFDGDGHTISHLTIDRGNDFRIGLFGYIDEGSVCNLTLDDATITGYDYVGGIAGDGMYASITNCHVISSVIRGYNYVGAIAGYLYVEYYDECGGGNTYHSTLVYGDTDNSDYHDGGDAFNIGVGKLDINGNEIYGNVEGRIELDAMKLILSDGRDNSDLIAAYADPYNHLAHYDYYYDDVPYVRDLEVTLRGRTLWKDGGWNTLCLPFDLESLTGTPLEGATVKTLSNSSFDNGTLTLNFTEATSIVAGQPYIVKWAEGNHLVNPVFTNKAITNTLTNSETDIIDFIGTYDPVDFGTEENRTVLLMGANNNLFYPDGTASSYVNAFRGYFQLHDGYVCGDGANGIKEFIVNFDGETTGISSMNNEQLTIDRDEVYDLQGRRVAQPAKGIYIVNGKKVYVK